MPIEGVDAMTELDKLKSAVKLIHDFCSKQIRCSECPFQIEKNYRDECLLEEYPYDWDAEKFPSDRPN